MSPKKRKQFQRKRTNGSSLELSVPTYGCTGFCERSCRKRKREILSKHGSFALANLEVIIKRISNKKTDGTIGFCNKCFILNKEFLARENAA